MNTLTHFTKGAHVELSAHLPFHVLKLARAAREAEGEDKAEAKARLNALVALMQSIMETPSHLWALAYFLVTEYPSYRDYLLDVQDLDGDDEAILRMWEAQ
jgi:hypothetical protein